MLHTIRDTYLVPPHAMCKNYGHKSSTRENYATKALSLTGCCHKVPALRVLATSIHPQLLYIVLYCRRRMKYINQPTNQFPQTLPMLEKFLNKHISSPRMLLKLTLEFGEIFTKIRQNRCNQIWGLDIPSLSYRLY